MDDHYLQQLFQCVVFGESKKDLVGFFYELDDKYLNRAQLKEKRAIANMSRDKNITLNDAYYALNTNVPPIKPIRVTVPISIKFTREDYLHNVFFVFKEDWDVVLNTGIKAPGNLNLYTYVQFYFKTKDIKEPVLADYPPLYIPEDDKDLEERCRQFIFVKREEVLKKYEAILEREAAICKKIKDEAESKYNLDKSMLVDPAEIAALYKTYHGERPLSDAMRNSYITAANAALSPEGLAAVQMDVRTQNGIVALNKLEAERIHANTLKKQEDELKKFPALIEKDKDDKTPTPLDFFMEKYGKFRTEENASITSRNKSSLINIIKDITARKSRNALLKANADTSVKLYNANVEKVNKYKQEIEWYRARIKEGIINYFKSCGEHPCGCKKPKLAPEEDARLKEDEEARRKKEAEDARKKDEDDRRERIRLDAERRKAERKKQEEDRKKKTDDDEKDRRADAAKKQAEMDQKEDEMRAEKEKREADRLAKEEADRLAQERDAQIKKEKERADANKEAEDKRDAAKKDKANKKKLAEEAKKRQAEENKKVHTTGYGFYLKNGVVTLGMLDFGTIDPNDLDSINEHHDNGKTYEIIAKLAYVVNNDTYSTMYSAEALEYHRWRLQSYYNRDKSLDNVKWVNPYNPDPVGIEEPDLPKLKMEVGDYIIQYPELNVKKLKNIFSVMLYIYYTISISKTASDKKWIEISETVVELEDAMTPAAIENILKQQPTFDVFLQAYMSYMKPMNELKKNQKLQKFTVTPTI